MKQCLEITVEGKVNSREYREHIQKEAQKLSLEGTINHLNDDAIALRVCGESARLDKLIDALYSRLPGVEIDNVIARPLVNEKDFRGVFRMIGFE